LKLETKIRILTKLKVKIYASISVKVFKWAIGTAGPEGLKSPAKPVKGVFQSVKIWGTVKGL